MTPRTRSLVLALSCLMLSGCPDDSSGSSGSGGAAGDASGGGGSNDTGGSANEGGSDSGGSAGSDAHAGTGGSAGKGGGSGSSGKGGGSGSSGKGGGGGSGGSSGKGGASGTGGAGGSVDEPKLPDNTLLYVRHETKDHDLLIARDLSANTERIVTDLTGDGSSGWEIDSFALSPDRRRIAFASLYAPTAEDTATGLATRAIWTMSTEGKNFVRLTPTFQNNSQGRSTYSIGIGDPEWLADGSRVLFGFGEYWWENGQLQGGNWPWSVDSQGGVPTIFETPSGCGHVLYPSRHPVTGDLLFYHGLCIPGQADGGGLYLYPATGTTTPKKLMDSAHVDGSVDLFLAKASWFPDGSGFAFVGSVMETNWTPSVLLYDAKSTKVFILAAAPADSTVYSVAVSTDGTKAVYCAHDNTTDADNLHLLDLAADPITDALITNDGKSCSPGF